METYERIDKLDEAKSHIEDAIVLIRQATRGTDQRDYVMAYLVPALEMAMGSDHEWLGHNPANIDAIIDNLRDADYNRDEGRTENEWEPAPPQAPPYWVGNDPNKISWSPVTRAIDFIKEYRRVYNCDFFEAINTQKYLKAHYS